MAFLIAPKNSKVDIKPIYKKSGSEIALNPVKGLEVAQPCQVIKKILKEKFHVVLSLMILHCLNPEEFRNNRHTRRLGPQERMQKKFKITSIFSRLAIDLQLSNDSHGNFSV